MPRRSVTRFFIPLIDVLILLFCIFLLMPFVSGQPEQDPAPDEKQTAPDQPLPDDVKTLQTLLAEEKLRVARLEKERFSKLTDRLTVRVLEIDPRDGTLVFYDPDRQEIKSEADALRLITRQKALASKGGVVKDIYFLIRFPGGTSAFPTVAQLDQYKQWFKDVPSGVDDH